MTHEKVSYEIIKRAVRNDEAAIAGIIKTIFSFFHCGKQS